MKNTIEVLRECGVVEKLQKALNIAPINLIDDAKEDPNMKEYQMFVFKGIISEALESDDDNKFTNAYFGAIHKDIIDALDLKKEGSGNEFLSKLVDLLKEIE